MTTYQIFLILAGLLIGSAIDAGADRFAREESWVAGRSRCRACDRPLAWYELLPLASWALAQGRCRTCRAPIGWAAPATETAGALIALAAVLWAPPGLLTLTVIFGWLLLTLAAIDFRTFILPDGLNAAVLAFGVVMLALPGPADWPMHIAGAAIGYGLLWGVEFAYRRLRGRDGLGRGDAKLLGAIGLWVGAFGIAPVLLIASLSGIAAALALSLRSSKALSGQSAIAFGPWIALGGYIVWLLQAAQITLPGGPV
jgi:prepilin signal peptidase PulO-like enzyme (type II secretory pathway)